jgi:meiotically up-regulated gene 157 (Mug157) protein
VNIDEDVKKVIKGMIERQLFYIRLDPYANAFNEVDNNNGHKGDITDHSPWVWERKFEIDSLCYPIFLAHRYYKVSNDATIFNQKFKDTVNVILDLFKTEQTHHEKSKYIHFRPEDDASFSVPNEGKGGSVAHTGLIWSGYRPSDDACEYGYFIPGNMFAVVILKQLEEIFTDISKDEELCAKVTALKNEIQQGIDKYGIIEHPEFGRMYAYEVDGLGNRNLMDDANVPSLLSLPYLGYCAPEDELYQNTRKFVLSKENRFYFAGKFLQGVGSPHTPENYVWHIGVIMQALTSNDQQEIIRLLEMVMNSDAGKMLMHEGVNVDDENEYTREWFAWANSLFAYFILDKKEYLADYFTK